MNAALRIILCVPGNLPEPHELASISSAVSFEQEEADARVPVAFRRAARSWLPSMQADDHVRIAEHPKVTYAISAPYEADEAPLAAHHMLRVGSALLERGGLAIKIESAGLAHSAAYWKRLTERADKTFARMQAAGLSETEQRTVRSEFWLTLLDAYVQLPIVEKDDTYSCGMHLLGRPELAVQTALLQGYLGAPNTVEHERSAARMMMAFGHHLLTEHDGEGLADGMTFRESEQQPTFVVRREEQRRYEPAEPFANPFGEYRLELA